MAASPARPSPLGGGIGLGLVSAAAFGTSGAFAKALLEAGWTPGAAVTTRIAIAAALLAVPTAVAMRGRWHLLRRHGPLVLLYGLLAVAGCQLFYFTAVQTLSVGVALLLEYLGLVLVVGWVWLVQGQRPTRWTLAGVVLAVVGLVLVLDVTGDMEVDAAGVGWGLAAAVGLAAFFVISARDTGELPPIAVVAGGMIVGAATLGLAGLVGIMEVETSRADVELGGASLPWWVPVLGLGVIAGALSYASGIAAARRLGARLAAFLGLTEVLFAILVAWLLLDELPLAVQLLGGALIVAGVAVVRLEELRRQEPLAEPAVGPEPLPPDAGATDGAATPEASGAGGPALAAG